MKFILWIANIFGNAPKQKVLIGVFIVILCTLAWRCHAAEIDLRAGSSFGPGGSGPALGLEMHFPIGNQVDITPGTTMWGATPSVANSWDWHVGFRTCRWRLCAGIGASYLQRIDAVNGSHTNYYLSLGWLLDWHRIASIDLAHLSNAGTSDVNTGRNSALVSIRLQ